MMRMSGFLKRLGMAAGVLAVGGLLAGISRPGVEGAPAAELRWFKGNTHCHTTESDGDSAPDVVAGWYADHGYDFLVLSDHNKLTPPGPVLEKVLAAEPKRKERPFLMIPGEEISQRQIEGKPVHVNGIRLKRVIPPVADGSTGRAAAMDANIVAVRLQGGVAHLNHPNWKRSNPLEVLRASRQLRMIEIWNTGPDSANDGADELPSVEANWDALLSDGRDVLGVAVDDAHHFQTWGPGKLNPGGAFVMVRATELTADAITEALRRGDFYPTTGILLEAWSPDPAQIAVRVRAEAGTTYRITFVGNGGRVLRRIEGTEAAYAPVGGEGYVRVRVDSSDGKRAWMQPVFLR